MPKIIKGKYCIHDTRKIPLTNFYNCSMVLLVPRFFFTVQWTDLLHSKLIFLYLSTLSMHLQRFACMILLLTTAFPPILYNICKRCFEMFKIFCYLYSPLGTLNPWSIITRLTLNIFMQTYSMWKVMLRSVRISKNLPGVPCLFICLFVSFVIKVIALGSYFLFWEEELFSHTEGLEK